jgi:hypothetical protein
MVVGAVVEVVQLVEVVGVVAEGKSHLPLP